MLARDLMTTNVATVAPETPVPEIAALLLERRISGVPVVDAAGRILGIVSEGDLIHRVEGDTERRRSWWLGLLTGAEDRAREYVRTHGRRAEDVMTRDVITVEEDAPLAEVAELLERRRIKRVPVVRDGRLVGIISRADLLRGLAAGRATATPASVSADDRAIRERLLKELDAQGLASLGYVNVVVSDGVVHLWGLVEGPEEGRAIRVAAETIPGVRAVEDHLGRRPPYTGAE